MLARRVFGERLYREAVEALSKPPVYGPDVEPWEPRASRGDGDAAFEAASTRLGEEIVRHSSYLQVDGRPIVEARRLPGGVIVESSRRALEEHEWARRYYWSLLSPGMDKYTSRLFLSWRGEGYFVYVPRGARLETPIYACMVIASHGYPQMIHNVIVVEEGGEATVITGCAAAPRASRALHIGVTEIHLAENARLNYVMIHSWNSDTHVRPRTAARLARGARLVSYYVAHGPVASLQQYPRILVGEEAGAVSASTILATSNSLYDVGAEAVLEGRGASAEIRSRIVARDSARVTARSRIRALAESVRGYTECAGLQLSREAGIHAVPELESRATSAELGHEASIGSIPREEIDYLLTRGFTEEEAVRLILQEFLYIDVPGLPRATRRVIEYTMRMLSQRHAV